MGLEPVYQQHLASEHRRYPNLFMGPAIHPAPLGPGARTSPISPCTRASCIWWLSRIGTAAKFCLGGFQYHGHGFLRLGPGRCLDEYDKPDQVNQFQYPEGERHPHLHGRTGSLAVGNVFMNTSGARSNMRMFTRTPMRPVRKPAWELRSGSTFTIVSDLTAVWENLSSDWCYEQDPLKTV